MKRKLTAPHINTYWLLSQSSLRLGVYPECAELLRERFLIASRGLIAASQLCTLCAPPLAVRCECANQPAEPPFQYF